MFSVSDASNYEPDNPACGTRLKVTETQSTGGFALSMDPSTFRTPQHHSRGCLAALPSTQGSRQAQACCGREARAAVHPLPDTRASKSQGCSVCCRTLLPSRGGGEIRCQGWTCPKAGASKGNSGRSQHREQEQQRSLPLPTASRQGPSRPRGRRSAGWDAAGSAPEPARVLRRRRVSTRDTAQPCQQQPEEEKPQTQELFWGRKRALTLPHALLRTRLQHRAQPQPCWCRVSLAAGRAGLQGAGGWSRRALPWLRD